MRVCGQRPGTRGAPAFAAGCEVIVRHLADTLPCSTRRAGSTLRSSRASPTCVCLCHTQTPTQTQTQTHTHTHTHRTHSHKVHRHRPSRDPPPSTPALAAPTRTRQCGVAACGKRAYKRRKQPAPQTRKAARSLQPRAQPAMRPATRCTPLRANRSARKRAGHGAAPPCGNNPNPTLAREAATHQAAALPPARARRPAKKPTYLTTQHCRPQGASQRHCVRAVKEMDSKSIGLCPQGFESPRCRLGAADRQQQ